ncbi:MAG: PqqD family peptide modification chaperone [Methanobrevibacter sp.]|nr:PqqD family peptide modification chaperone [Candidatus Methanovirga procula]
MLCVFPVIREGYCLHLGSSLSFLYDFEDLSDCVSLNTDAINILRECDGLSNIEEIIHNLSSKYGEDPEEIKDVVSFFILNNKYLDIFDEPKPREIVITGSKDLQVPLHLLVELTDFCNWNCKHCFNDSSPIKHDFIDKDKLINFLRELGAMGTNTLNLSGGEPLSHPQLDEIVEVASKLFQRIVILSNGTLINEKHIDVFKKYKDKITLRLTLNSSTSEYMDDFVGKSGAFNKVNEVISQVSSEGVNVEVAMVCTPYNKDDRINVANLSRKLGASKVEIGIITSIGRATDYDDLIFSPDDFRMFEDKVRLLIDEFGDYIGKSEEYQAMSDDNENSAFQAGNCGVGLRTISVTPTGKVKLCPIDVNSFFSVGNVLDEDLKSVLLRMEKIGFDKIDKPQATICGQCEHLFFCSNCIVKAVLMNNKIGNSKCVWGEKYLQTQ